MKLSDLWIDTPGSRSFAWFLTSTFAAAAGRNWYFIVCAWSLVADGRGSVRVAIFLAIVSLVEFVASPIVGIIVDRYERRRLNIGSDLMRSAVMLGTTLPIYCGASMFAVLCVSGAIFSICDRLSLTASQSLIPSLAPSRPLETANAAVFLAMQGGNLAAALLAGMLLGDRFPIFTLTPLCLVFLFSACAMVPVDRRSARRSSQPVGNQSAVVGKVRIARLSIIYALLYGGAVLMSVAAASYVLDERGGDASDFARLEGAWSIGAIVGAAVLARAPQSANPRRVQLVTLTAMAMILMALKFLETPWMLIAVLCLGACYNLGRACLEVMAQLSVPDASLGRAKGIMHCVAVGLSLVLFGFAALAGDAVRPSTIFAGYGVLMILGVATLLAFECQPRLQQSRGQVDDR